MGVTVIGFCGLAVEGGAGVRAPVFAHPEGFYFIGDPDAPIPDASRWARAELEALEQRGTICVVSQGWPRVASGVVLYAHPDFVQPGERRLALTDELADFYRDEKLGVYLRYLTREEALGQLRTWAKRLLEDARMYLRPRRSRSDWERALDSAERARVVAPPPDLADLRVEAFVLLGAAWLALDKDFEDVLWDAKTERDEALLRAVNERARARGEFVREGLTSDLRAIRRDRPVLRFGRPGAPARRAA